MRSAAVLAFSGLAAAALIPAYDAPSPVYEDAPVTEYSTQVVTITSCAPEVTECPADSTVTSSSVYTSVYYPVPEESSAYPEPSKDYPAPEESSAYEEPTKGYPEPSKGYPEPSKGYPEPSKGYPEPSAEYPEPPKTTGYPIPTKPTEELCPTESVKTVVYTEEVVITTSTVLTKYETATLEVPCPEPTKPSASYPVPPPPVPSGNATTPYPPPGEPSGPAEAGAAGVSGSVFVAAFAAIAAFVLV